MRIMYQRCCGIDVHKKMLVACLLMSSDQGVHKEIQMFSTMLSDLFRLREWLTAEALRGRGDGEYRCLWEVYLECAGRGDGATVV